MLLSGEPNGGHVSTNGDCLTDVTLTPGEQRTSGGVLSPPSGDPPPVTVTMADGRSVDLLQLATEICQRYHQEFTDEHERYGAAATAWCVHDLRHVLNWAAGEVNGHFKLVPQVEWLAGILEVRASRSSVWRRDWRSPPKSLAARSGDEMARNWSG